ncbi:hypothetical protein Dshi_0077 [Dinoroseobacter shibae DFL 12 = DSM 16493]|uniref:Uncharacterized protein n=3 Tax=Dinoroseobacter TaxID=309512 RepID=A8LK00_DINSH|nr:hypothetical protein Dshi_0077 [Dinoroseobacter shibae DFL 12 = DSM 16493]
MGACPEHAVLLEPLPRPPGYRGAKDLHLCLGLWPDRHLPDPRPVASHELDLAVQTFLADGTDRVGGWSLAEALATAPLLGCFVEIGPVKLKELGEADLQRCTETGFSLLRDGPGALKDAVGWRIRKRLAEGARSPEDVLGCLNGTLRHFRDVPAYRPLLDAVHGAATRHMQRHWAYSFLNRVIPAFDHATVETLSQSHGVSRGSVRFALAADKVPTVGHVSAFGKTYRVYDRSAAERAIARVQDTVSFDEARQLLGMRRFTFEKVWPARVLGRASSWPQRKSRPWRHEVVALRDAF